MPPASAVTAIAAVVVLLATALWVAPRLQRRTRVRFGTRALTVLSIGLLVAAALVVLSFVFRLTAG